MTAIMPFASHARWPRPVVALVAARAVNQLGAFALSFLTITLVEVHGAALTTAGWVVALFGLATIPSRLLGGWLADAIGHRPTIVAGLLGCSVALTVIATAPGIAGAAIGALLLGLVFEIYEPPSQALLADLVPPERRPQAFGLLGSALAVAAVAAGGLAALLGGADLRLLFGADAATCVAAAVLVSALVVQPPGEREAADSGAAARHRPWRDRRLLVMLAAGTGNALVWTLGTVALPVTVAARGHETACTGWLLALGALVTIAGQRRLRTASSAPFRLIGFGLLAVAAGFATLAYAAGLAALAAGAALVAFGQVFLLGPPYAVVAGLADHGSRAAYLAAFGVSWGVAQSVGPVIATRLLEAGVAVAWLAGAALCLALAAAQPFVARAVLVDPA